MQLRVFAPLLANLPLVGRHAAYAPSDKVSTQFQTGRTPASEQPRPVALLVISAIAHDTAAWTAKTTKGDREIDHSLHRPIQLRADLKVCKMMGRAGLPQILKHQPRLHAMLEA
jgi:hypothetical protein